jgi:hypothetical protein
MRLQFWATVSIGRAAAGHGRSWHRKPRSEMPNEGHREAGSGAGSGALPSGWPSVRTPSLGAIGDGRAQHPPLQRPAVTGSKTVLHGRLPGPADSGARPITLAECVGRLGGAQHLWTGRHGSERVCQGPPEATAVPPHNAYPPSSMSRQPARPLDQRVSGMAHSRRGEPAGDGW